jgi:hypothetical protein
MISVVVGKGASEDQDCGWLGKGVVVKDFRITHPTNVNIIIYSASGPKEPATNVGAI